MFSPFTPRRREDFQSGSRYPPLLAETDADFVIKRPPVGLPDARMRDTGVQRYTAEQQMWRDPRVRGWPKAGRGLIKQGNYQRIGAVAQLARVAQRGWRRRPELLHTRGLKFRLL